MLVQEQAVGGLQRLVVVGGDRVGDGLRKQVEGVLPTIASRDSAELGLGHAVDQHVAAVAHILHRDLRRDVIDDLAQEGVVAVAFLFEVAALGDVLDRRDPSALRQRLVDDRDRSVRPAISMMRVVDLALRDVAHDRLEQNSSTSPSKDPVSLRCWIRSRKWQPGFTTSVDRSYMSM